MEIKAYITTDIDINRIQEDMTEYIDLCYSYPLVFFEANKMIAFYSVEIELEPKEFQLLKVLVTNRTKKKVTKKPFGLSPKNLYNKIKCKSRNSEKIESDYYIRRMTKYKSDIFAKIKREFLRDPNNVQKGYKELIEEDKWGKQFKGHPITIDSPYYNFKLDSALKNLIYYKKNLNSHKVCTDFYFSVDIK